MPKHLWAMVGYADLAMRQAERSIVLRFLFLFTVMKPGEAEPFKKLRCEGGPPRLARTT